MLRVGDKVREGSEEGVIVAIHTPGTADVKFPSRPFAIRRQAKNLVRLSNAVPRRNPMSRRSNRRLRRVPDDMRETPRSAAEDLYVFPRQQSFPIGDLFHARLALVYALSPTHASQRKKVAQAVQKAYPSYDWGAWWNARKKKGVPTWSALTSKKKSSRKMPLAANPRNPFALTRRRNGRQASSKMSNAALAMLIAKKERSTPESREIISDIESKGYATKGDLRALCRAVGCSIMDYKG